VAQNRKRPDSRTAYAALVFRLFYLGIIGYLCWYLSVSAYHGGNQPKDPAPPARPPEVRHLRPVDACTRLITYVVKPGDTFLSILSRKGLRSDLAMALQKAFRPLGLSSLFPGDSCVMSLSSAGTVSAFSVLSRLQAWYRATIDSSAAVRARKTPVVISLQRYIVRGTLTTSLSQDLFYYDVGDAIVSKFADIFAWDINFFVDPQEGDSFTIVFEKKFAAGKYVGYGEILAAKYINNGHVYYAMGMKQGNEPVQYYDLEGKSLQKEFLKAPLHFNRISSRFSLHRRHPVLGIVRPHLGIDYAASVGTPVYSAADGKIVFAGIQGGFGNFIRIAHGGAYETCYGHLSDFARGIHAGSIVKQGDCIGHVGLTGITTGAHLDYRMMRGGRFVNPLAVSLPAKGGVGHDEVAGFSLIKTEYRAVFSYRFVGREGCFPLDVETADTARAIAAAAALEDSGKRAPAVTGAHGS
jgi:murein DD-endopeptidase MepM/ murein hydrolase activator NlpD